MSALAVLDGLIATSEALSISDALHAERLPVLREARAAIGELIEAAEVYMDMRGPNYGKMGTRVIAALQRVRGASA